MVHSGHTQNGPCGSAATGAEQKLFPMSPPGRKRPVRFRGPSRRAAIPRSIFSRHFRQDPVALVLSDIDVKLRPAARLHRNLSPPSGDDRNRLSFCLIRFQREVRGCHRALKNCARDPPAPKGPFLTFGLAPDEAGAFGFHRAIAVPYGISANLIRLI